MVESTDMLLEGYMRGKRSVEVTNEWNYMYLVGQGRILNTWKGLGKYR